MGRELKPEDVGMDPDFVKRMRSYYEQQEIKKSEMYKEMLKKIRIVR
jgi:hypothetical protein